MLNVLAGRYKITKFLLPDHLNSCNFIALIHFILYLIKTVITT
jgi:hypothetical protein